MSRIAYHSMSAIAAVVLAISSITAIVSVPQAQAMSPVAVAELA